MDENLLRYGVGLVRENFAQVIGNRLFGHCIQGDVREHDRPIARDEVFEARAKRFGQALESRRILEEMRERVDVREKGVTDAFFRMLGVVVVEFRLAVENEVREKEPRRRARGVLHVGLWFGSAQHVGVNDAVDARGTLGLDLIVKCLEKLDDFLVVDAVRPFDFVEETKEVRFVAQVPAGGGDRALGDERRTRRAQVVEVREGIDPAL